MRLSTVQREILGAVISVYREKGKAVKGEDVARVIGRMPGTVRNQMQSLKTLGLIEAAPGPKGGYKATSSAYEALAITLLEEEVVVPVYRNNREVKGVTVENINFTTLRHPYICNTSVRMIGDIRVFEIGDIVEIGPTPVNNFVIRGVVIGRDDTNGVLVCKISNMILVPRKLIVEIAKDLITIPSDAAVEDGLRILLENDINCAPIVENSKIIGIVSLREMSKAMVSDKMSDNIMEIAIEDAISIEAEKSLVDAARLMDKREIGSLIVMVEGTPKGIVTKKDVLKELVV